MARFTNGSVLKDEHSLRLEPSGHDNEEMVLKCDTHNHDVAVINEHRTEFFATTCLNKGEGKWISFGKGFA